MIVLTSPLRTFLERFLLKIKGGFKSLPMYYVFPYIYWFLSKTTKYDGNIFTSRTRSGNFLPCFYVHVRRARDDTIRGTMEDSDRQSQVNFIDVCKSLGWLSVIIRSQQFHQSTWKTSQ